ncbi:MAG: Crp/Fnr family transcriptional regulator [Bdellovibrionales bacterium]|nr:Crp/Fnr family transcriptional regulator [Bdellovibrionales bacterium]
MKTITTGSLVDCISTIPAFSHFSKHEIVHLSTLATRVLFEPSEELLFLSNKNEFCFYVLLKGHARLGYQTHTLHPVRICGPGDFLGYGEWNFKHRHTAEALDPIEAIIFQRESFQKFLHSSPTLQEAMIKVLCDILSIKDERISALENHSVGNRVASVLLSFSEKFGKESKEGIRIDVKVDRDTIAKLAGTVIESLSRQLSELESEHIIRREGRSIVILEREKLLAKSRL